MFAILSKRLFWVLYLLLIGISVTAWSDEGLEKAAQKANNPVSDAWLLISQYDFTELNGDAVSGSEYRHRLSFQPVMPVPGTW